MGSLDGRVPIVTGAGSGIGRGSAEALAGAGATLVVADIDAARAADTVAGIEAMGGRASVGVVDVRDSAQIRALVDSTEERFGGLDVLHANAGVERYAELDVAEESDIDLILAVDLKGVLLCAQHAIPAMRRRGGGSIIRTSSVQATHSLPGAVVYSATKAGAVAAARTLAVEVGLFGIRVNSLAPGTIETPMLRDALHAMPLTDPADARAVVSAANALRRIGAVTEVGAAVVFLVGDESFYITGTNLVVDGGFTAVKTS